MADEDIDTPPPEHEWPDTISGPIADRWRQLGGLIEPVGVEHRPLIVVAEQHQRWQFTGLRLASDR